MVDTTTTNYGLTKPEVGSSNDTWGAKLNTDLDMIDAAMTALLKKDGTNSPTADVAWAGHNLTGVGALTGGSYSFSGNAAVGGYMSVVGVLTASGTLVANTPNLGTTGGVRIAGNATSGLAVLQFVDATLATEWGYLTVNSAGNFSLGGSLTVTGNTHVTYGSTVKDAAGTDRLIGMLEMPPTATTGGRVIALADSGFCIVATGNMTIPTDAATNFPVGSMVGIYNDGAGAISITAVAPGTTTLRLGGSGSTGARSLAVGGMVIMWKKAANYWVALNGGVS